MKFIFALEHALLGGAYLANKLPKTWEVAHVVKLLLRSRGS